MMVVILIFNLTMDLMEDNVSIHLLALIVSTR